MRFDQLCLLIRTNRFDYSISTFCDLLEYSPAVILFIVKKMASNDNTRFSVSDIDMPVVGIVPSQLRRVVEEIASQGCGVMLDG